MQLLPAHHPPATASATPPAPPPQEEEEEDDDDDDDAHERGGEGGHEPPSLQQLQLQHRAPSRASSLGSASSWVELRENGAEALRLQVETEVREGRHAVFGIKQSTLSRVPACLSVVDTLIDSSHTHTRTALHRQAARAAALRLAVAREQEAAQQTAALAQHLLQQERCERQRRQEAALDGLAARLRRYAAARVLGMVRRGDDRRLGRAWVRWGFVWVFVSVGGGGMASIAYVCV